MARLETRIKKILKIHPKIAFHCAFLCFVFLILSHPILIYIKKMRVMAGLTTIRFNYAPLQTTFNPISKKQNLLKLKTFHCIFCPIKHKKRIRTNGYKIKAQVCHFSCIMRTKIVNPRIFFMPFCLR